jgi:hypothetical protein
MFTAADKNTCRKNRRTIRNHIDRFCIINTHVILCSREYQCMYVCMYVCIRRYTFAFVCVQIRFYVLMRALLC